ncbi:MAG TPA: hypothetical protein VFK05_05690 [Polyangiaceae bacterium]|nr:hypothetical protein [Polyangiaceae bacterium]
MQRRPGGSGDARGYDCHPGYNQDCEAGFDEARKQAERLRKSGSVDLK